MSAVNWGLRRFSLVALSTAYLALPAQAQEITTIVLPRTEEQLPEVKIGVSRRPISEAVQNEMLTRIADTTRYVLQLQQADASPRAPIPVADLELRNRLYNELRDALTACAIAVARQCTIDTAERRGVNPNALSELRDDRTRNLAEVMLLTNFQLPAERRICGESYCLTPSLSEAIEIVDALAADVKKLLVEPSEN